MRRAAPIGGQACEMDPRTHGPAKGRDARPGNRKLVRTIQSLAEHNDYASQNRVVFADAGNVVILLIASSSLHHPAVDRCRPAAIHGQVVQGHSITHFVAEDRCCAICNVQAERPAAGVDRLIKVHVGARHIRVRAQFHRITIALEGVGLHHPALDDRIPVSVGRQAGQRCAVTHLVVERGVTAVGVHLQCKAPIHGAGKGDVLPG